ncbi:MAG: SHOCT domain-containing protein [Actinomycetota bacterium]|nr:SHOCT domain-containing protein [Actinomycetota bacterium]
MMWWSNSGWGAGSWTVMVLMMVLFWGAVITVGVWAVRRGRAGVRDGGASMPLDRADRDLAERLARGEIDEAQFTRTRSTLHSSDSSRPDSQV